METFNFIDFSVIIFSLIVGVFVEFIMYRKPPTKQKISDYQKILDKSDKEVNEDFGLNWKHDSRTEIFKSRRIKKGLTYMFSGMLVTIILFILVIDYSLSSVNMIILPACGLFLFIFGILKVIGNRKSGLVFLVIAFFVALLTEMFIDKIRLPSFSVFLNVCLVICVVMFFSGLASKKEY